MEVQPLFYHCRVSALAIEQEEKVFPRKSHLDFIGAMKELFEIARIQILLCKDVKKDKFEEKRAIGKPGLIL